MIRSERNAYTCAIIIIQFTCAWVSKDGLEIFGLEGHSVW